MTTYNVHDVKEWFEVLDTTERTQTAVMVLLAGGYSSEAMSIQETGDQVLLLLEGELQAEVGEERLILRTGDTCIVSAGMAYRFENRAQNRAVTFNVYSPC